jgi:hypothetical protein
VNGKAENLGGGAATIKRIKSKITINSQAHTKNSSQEAETGGSRVRSYPGLHNDETPSQKKITMTSKLTFSKRYLKYLFKKYLKKNNL